MTTRNILLLSALATVSLEASAFTLIGTNSSIKGWNTKEIEFHLNTDNCPSNVEDLINDAMKVWNEVPTAGLTVKLGDPTDASIADLKAGTSADMPAIVCSTDLATDANLDANVIPGLAMGANVDSGGHINAGYLILNVQTGARADINTLDAELVKVVIAHEIGHVLGLGHSESDKALMYYDATAKKHLALSQDDRDGLNYLYPRNELAGDNLLGGCASIGMGDKAFGWGLIALLLVPFAVMMKPRRKKLRAPIRFR